MKPYSCILDKTEEAIALAIQSRMQSEAVGWTINKAGSNDTLGPQRIEVLAQQADIEKFGDIVTGNYMVTCMVTIVSDSHDVDRDSHRACSGAIADIMQRDDIVELLNAQRVVDFTVLDNGYSPTRIVRESEEMAIMTAFQFTLYAMPKTRE